MGITDPIAHILKIGFSGLARITAGQLPSSHILILSLPTSFVITDRRPAGVRNER
jgi:hypothetical protein